MGRLTRWLLALALGVGLWLATTGVTSAFDGFGEQSAESTFGREMRFEVALPGGAPERLELLLRTPGDESVFVAPADDAGTSATYIWDTTLDHVTPNTLVTYRWRAIDGEEVTLSEEATLRYVDDREGLDWQSTNLGDATVHWYGPAETQALRFGELTAEGVQRGEDLLGTQLAGPVDVFVYDTREEFFGALGPGAREWTGAAAFSELRTIFMWLGGGSEAYLEQAMIHELMHIVFYDATDNPYHEPARWLNEGIATWAEDFDGADEAAIVRLEAGGAGLFAFEAIEGQFPIGERGGRLSYAQGTAMIDLIVDTYGQEALAAIAAAYLGGASDAEALEAGTGVPAQQLYGDFYASFGVAAPEPVAVEPIGASVVDRPPAGPVDAGGVDGPVSPPPAEGTPGEPADTDASPAPDAVVIVALVLVAAAALAAAFLLARRAGSRSSA